MQKTSGLIVKLYTCLVYPQSLFFNKTAWKMLKWESISTPILFWCFYLAYIDLHYVSLSVSPFLLRHFNFHGTLFLWSGWRLKGWRSGPVTGSLNSCDWLEKTGWGKLMCNTLLCPYGYCQGATEQGTYCVSRCSRHSYTQQAKATCVSVLINCRSTLRKPSLDK